MRGPGNLIGKLEKFILFIIVLLLAAMCCTKCCNVHAAEPDVGLWLARSCTGEAGWNSHTTDECATLLHIYKKRSVIRGTDILSTAKAYSAAIKQGAHSRNPWVRHLDRIGNKPKHWPRGASWKKHRERWMETLAFADSFLAGQVSDPYEHAVHYGSRIDHHRAVKAGWWRIKAPGLRNFIYSLRRPTQEEK